MSIENELSSDVATALLAAGEGASPRDAGKLAAVAKEVHSALRQMEAESRRKYRRMSGSGDEPSAGRAASG